jgi:hypothetical protein
MHTLVYAEDPDQARAFFRDVLQMPCSDVGEGWLIFKSGPSELAAHPASWEHEGTKGHSDQRFDLSFMCDDLDATVAELEGRGATFGETSMQGWGRTIQLIVPGFGPMTLYQPRYEPPATSLA